MDIYGQIAQAIRNIAGVQVGGATIFPAEVKSVSGAACSILIGDLEVTDVRLRAVINDKDDQILRIPKQGSQVLVADMSGGQFRELVVIEQSETEKVDLSIGQTTITIEDGKITINGGNNNGLVNIQDLTNKLNELVNAFNNHTHTTTATVGPTTTVGTLSTPVNTANAFKKSDYEDTTVKH